MTAAGAVGSRHGSARASVHHGEAAFALVACAALPLPFAWFPDQASSSACSDGGTAPPVGRADHGADPSVTASPIVGS